jgi:O-acetylhomoserine/O-acetylserine sulfhydrylase-like pyridoxal-dependent enzyme
MFTTQMPREMRYLTCPPVSRETRISTGELMHTIHYLVSSPSLTSRIGNPTVDAFERRVSALEGGIAAVACSSGQAAQFMALTCIANSGDNIVCESRRCV